MRNVIGVARVSHFVENLFEEDLHAKRLLSLSNATAGAVRAGAMGVHAIGRGLAAARRSSAKHSIKQVDRLLSNPGIDVWALFARWVPYVVAARTEVRVVLDWTEFERDKQSTLVASLVTEHGRTTPLMWLSQTLSNLEAMRANVEDLLLTRLKEVLPATVTKVVIVGDRGFGNPERWAIAQALGMDFIYRVRKDMRVTDEKGLEKAAEEWVAPGRTVTLKGARMTQEKVRLGAFVAVHAPKMKEPWLLSTSLGDVSGPEVVKQYGKRFTIEESFRDIKDLRFGMGLSASRISTPERRDRLLLLSALTIALLTLLGAAGEAAGIDRHFKANTSKKRQYSLFRQGCDYYEFLPDMRDEWALPLVEKFAELIKAQPLFAEALEVL